jgi:hypothetical protein
MRDFKMSNKSDDKKIKLIDVINKVKKNYYSGMVDLFIERYKGISLEDALDNIENAISSFIILKKDIINYQKGEI